jgi:hypothetical protein
VPVVVILVGGIAYVGCIEPEPPQGALLLAAAAPMALWPCAFAPLALQRGARGLAMQAAAVLSVWLAAAAWLLLAGKPPTGEY